MKADILTATRICAQTLPVSNKPLLAEWYRWYRSSGFPAWRSICEARVHSHGSATKRPYFAS